MRFRNRCRGDDGASLILVLVFMVSFALIVPALLTQSQTNVSSVKFTRDIGDRSNDARFAADAALNQLRNGTFYNAPSQPCFHDPADLTGANDSSALVLDGPNTGKKVLVTCQAEPATGYPTSVKVAFNASNTPGSALLTLSRAAGEDGIRHDKNNTLRVQGRVFSNSTINVSNSNASLITNRALYARSNCTGDVQGQPKSCNDTANDPLGVDPNYSLPTTLPETRSAPPCSSSTRTYTLSPGTYRSAAALSALTASSCSSPLLHFTPGVYYFDFTDPTPVWSISAGYVVAGTAASGSRAWTLAGYPGSPPPVPGACITPMEGSPANNGVQFIFGGASRMAVSGGARVEICGNYSTTSPPIAVFGANATTGLAPTTTTALVATGTAKSTGNPKFENPERMRVRDGQTSDAALKDKEAASISGTIPVSGLPPGATLLSATVRVAHRDLEGPPQTSGGTTFAAGPLSSLTLAVQATKSGGGAANPSTTLPVPITTTTSATSPIVEDALDITDYLKTYFGTPTFTGIETTFAANPSSSRAATAQLDSIQLDLSYELPGFRKQNGCVTATPYGSSGTCAVVSTSNSAGALYIQGTTYAPDAALDIDLNNVSEQVFRFGLIARMARLAITGSSTFADAVISVPDETPGFADVVPLAALLQVYVCETGTCAAPTPAAQGYVPPNGSGWVRRLSTRAVVSDAQYPPTAGLRQVKVESWSHVR